MSTQKPCLVFLIGSMRRGGAERVISILANDYAQRGWEVNILTLLDDRNEYNLEDSVQVIPICQQTKSRIVQLPYWIKTIRRFVRKKKPERIVSFIARINIVTILSCMGLNQRLIISERNDPKADGRSFAVRLMTKWLYPKAEKVIFQTTFAKKCFSTKIQKKSHIIPNPIRVTVKAVKCKERKMVSVGRLVEQKNHALLIQVFKKLHNDYPDYKLYIYGDGWLRETLENLIQELDLMQSVFLPGNVPNIHEQIADAELFILPSNYEGLSNALLEAMVMGLPCLSTNCAGSNEIIENEKNGLLIPVGSFDALYRAIYFMLKNKDIARQLGKEAEKLSLLLNHHHVLNQWHDVLEGQTINTLVRVLSQ